MSKRYERTFYQRYSMANKHIKRSSKSLVIREMINPKNPPWLLFSLQSKSPSMMTSSGPTDPASSPTTLRAPAHSPPCCYVKILTRSYLRAFVFDFFFLPPKCFPHISIQLHPSPPPLLKCRHFNKAYPGRP